MELARINRARPTCFIRAHGPTVLLAIVFLMTVGIACTGTGAAPQSETDVVAEVPEPTSAVASIDGTTWILESVDGRPPIAGTYLTLTINGPHFGGFDGCNSFGGQHQSGTPVIKPDGAISVPPFGGTDAGCPTDTILDQAKRYLGAMTQQAKARVVDDRLHIMDSSGKVALVFARQAPLAGQPIDLASTRWRLVDHDGAYGDRPTTLVFVDEQVALGTTACRDYTMGYSASEGRIRIPSHGMSGSTEPCPKGEVRKEHQFGEDFGWANEYAMNQAEGYPRLVVRTSRGKTLTFEPVDQTSNGILGVRWRLIRFFERRQGGSMARLADTDAEPSADITATFDEGAVKGLLGCHSYVYRPAGGEGTTFVGEDGTMSLDAADLSTDNACDDQAGVSPQQRQYLDYLAAAERYFTFEDRLVIVTHTGDALMFEPEIVSPRTHLAPAEFEYRTKDLAAWLSAVVEAAGRDSGIFMTSIDERDIRIQIRMRPSRGGLERLEAAIAQVNVPREAVVVEIGCIANALNHLDKGKSPKQAFLAAIGYSLEAPSQAAYGKTVGVKVTLRNISNEPVLVPMGSVPAYDFVISTIEGENIWRWQCGQVILDIMGGETLEPGEEMELVGEWEQVDNRGEPVPAGTYLIRGALMMDPPERLVTPPHRLEVLN